MQSRLSVSSVGSWALQLDPRLRRRNGSRPFQYPRSDRGHCNHASQSSLVVAADSFSILGRIVGTATPCMPARRMRPIALSVSSVGSWALQLRRRSGCSRCAVSFQYPRSDRGHCNYSTCRGLHASTCDFQYPRSDRGHCNQSDESCQQYRQSTFSILGRIVGTATHTARAVAPASLTLSVSSVGSWALQPARVHDRAARFSDFQYPRSDRGHCNRSYCTDRSTLTLHLSVSSVGSWALQLDCSAARTARTVGFQYPRSDRGHCNLRRAMVRCGVASSFSILGRIVGTATTYLPHPLTSQPAAFSILGRIVGTATPPAQMLAAAAADLSVSSVGSWALQHLRSCAVVR